MQGQAQQGLRTDKVTDKGRRKVGVGEMAQPPVARGTWEQDEDTVLPLPSLWLH